METMTESRKQVVAGVTAPQLGEALIREIFPSVTAIPAAAPAAPRRNCPRVSIDSFSWRSCAVM